MHPEEILLDLFLEPFLGHDVLLSVLVLSIGLDTSSICQDIDIRAVVRSERASALARPKRLLPHFCCDYSTRDTTWPTSHGDFSDFQRRSIDSLLQGESAHAFGLNM